MRLKISNEGFKVWLSARETEQWAWGTPEKFWPGSQFAGRRIFAEFDSNGLCDFTLNGKSRIDFWEGELLAILSDLVSPSLPEGHLWKNESVKGESNELPAKP